MIALLAVAMLTGAGCGGGLIVEGRAVTLTEKARWQLVESPHFTLHTDLSPSDAVEAVADLERAYRTFWDLADFLFPALDRAAPDGKMLVFQFAHRRDFAAITGDDDHPGMFIGVPNASPLLLIRGALVDDTRRIFLHELGHRFVAHYAPSAPAWLHEGIARYYESIEVVDGAARLGIQPPSVVVSKVEGKGLRVYSLPSVKDLLAASHARFHDDSREWLGVEQREFGYYTGAWGLVHLLNNGPESLRPLFLAYVRALSDGAVPAAAWQSAFATVPIEALEAEYRAHFLRIDTRVFVTPYSVPNPPPATVRQMTREEATLVLQALRRGFSHKPARKSAR